MIPEEIKIGGILYKVIFNDAKVIDATGKIVFGSAIIYLDEQLCPDMAKATLLHEVIESINEENELKMKHRVIQTLATQLFQVLKDNPGVFR